MLSILGNDAVAVPLCPAFPDSELRYILNQSESSVLVTSPKYKAKADSVMQEGLDCSPNFLNIAKLAERNPNGTAVSLEASSSGKGGMMLYTSGTTSRPV
jgi:malonyl-CoA/methylmalonyl-CoA synthetase